MTGADFGPEAWILEAGVQLLHSEGPRSLTARRVARRAGVAVGTLYAHFAEMRALRDAVYTRFRREQHLGLAELCNPTLYPPVSGLGIALKRVVGTFIDAALAARAADPAGRIDEAELGEPATDPEVRQASVDVVRAMRSCRGDRWRPETDAAIDLLALGLPTAIRAMAYRDPQRVAAAEFRELLVSWAARYLLKGAAGHRVAWDWHQPSETEGWQSRIDVDGEALRELSDPGDSDPTGAASVRSRLIAAATHLHVERGRTPRAREVARAARVSPGSIYYHFGSLSVLMREAHDVRVRGSLERATEDHQSLAGIPLRHALAACVAVRMRAAAMNAHRRPRSGGGLPFAADDPDFMRASLDFGQRLLESHADEVREIGRDDLLWILTVGIEGLLRPFQILAPERLLEAQLVREVADWTVLFSVRDACLGL